MAVGAPGRCLKRGMGIAREGIEPANSNILAYCSAGAVKARLRRAGIVAIQFIGLVATYGEAQARVIATPRPNGRPHKVKE